VDVASAEFTGRTEPYRRELLAHCYRMLGSVTDAEDLVQDTLLRAWRAYPTYDPQRASVRTWLYRIASNACLTALAGRVRRPLPAGLGPPDYDPRGGFVPGLDVPWLQPVPDTRLADPADPAGTVLARGSLRLAIVAALQLLPPRQRAVLILRDVLSWSATEVSEALGLSVPAVNSALQRARARLAQAQPREDEITEPAAARAVVDRYVRAFERADLTALKDLLISDVVLEMPPMRNWFRGTDDFVAFVARVYEVRGTDWRLLPVGANGQPALAGYARAADGCAVTAAGLARLTVFMAPAVFDLFDLPERLPADAQPAVDLSPQR
jgi:RNA polymerase sigma-70 factor (ECF subfamily)